MKAISLKALVCGRGVQWRLLQQPIQVPVDGSSIFLQLSKYVPEFITQEGVLCPSLTATFFSSVPEIPPGRSWLKPF
jgi:hypothetical protein